MKALFRWQEISAVVISIRLTRLIARKKQENKSKFKKAFKVICDSLKEAIKVEYICVCSHLS